MRKDLRAGPFWLLRLFRKFDQTGVELSAKRNN